MWESTTNALNLMGPNGLSLQYPTHSPPPAAQKRHGSARALRARPRDAENCTPAALNSPPRRRVLEHCDSLSEIGSPYFTRQVDVIKRQANPTRSPVKPRKESAAPPPAPPPPPMQPLQVKAPPPAQLPPKTPLSPEIVRHRQVVDQMLQDDHLKDLNDQFDAGNVDISTPQAVRKSPFKRNRVFSLKHKTDASASEQRKKFSLSKKHTDTMRSRGSTEHLALTLQRERTPSDFRLAAVEEFTKCEKLFCERIKRLMAVSQQLKGAMPADDWRLVFSNLDAISTTSTELSRELHTIQDADTLASNALGDLLLRMAPFMKNYQSYLVNYKSAQRIFTSIKSTRSVVSALEGLKVSVQDVEHWLADPMQRIMRYKMHIGQILEHTPVVHADFGNLTLALEKYRILIEDINEEVRRQEGKMNWRDRTSKMHHVDREQLAESEPVAPHLTSSRQLLYEGSFEKKSEKAELDFSPDEGMSTGDRLINDMIMVHEKDMTGDLFSPMLDPVQLPHRSAEDSIDPALAAYRAEHPDDDLSTMDGESDAESVHLLLSDDVLAVTFLQDDDVCLETAIPLEVCWVVPHSRFLVIASPGNYNYCLQLGAVGPSPVFGADAPQSDQTLVEWQRHIARAIKNRVTNDKEAAKRRSACALYVEDNWSICIEERKVKLAERGTEATAMQALEEVLKLGLEDNNGTSVAAAAAYTRVTQAPATKGKAKKQTKPKKKGGLFGSRPLDVKK